MPKWDEITKNEKYQNLPPEARAQLKTEWFKANLLPEIESKPSLKEMGVEKVYEWFMQQPDDTGQGYVTSMLGSAGRGFGEMVPGAIEGVGALTGSEGLREFGQDVRGGLESISPVNPIYAESIPVKLAGVGGQVGSVLATAGAGGAVGKALGGVGAATTGMRAAPLASAFLQGSAEGAREAEQYGMTGPEAYLRTLAGGATEAGTELLPFGMAAETALAKRVLTSAPRTGTFLGAIGSEAGEEGIGQIASNLATQTLAPVGVQTPGLMEGALEAAAYGAAGGGMIGGVNALISTPPEKQTQIQKDLQAEAGAIPKDTVPDQTNEEKMAAMDKGGITVVDPEGKTAVITPEPEPEPSMPDPAEVAKTIGESSVEQLAATGNEASAAAQADFNAILDETLGKTPEPTIQPEQAAEEVGAEVTPSPEGASMPMMVTRDMKQQLVDLGYSKADINAMRPEDAAAIIKSGVSKNTIPPTEQVYEPNIQETLQQEQSGGPIINEAPIITPEEESLAAKRRADLLSSAADVAKGKKKAQVSPAVTAMVTPQTATTQENAPSPIQIQESVRQEPQDRIESREAEETGAGDQLRSPAEGEEEVVSVKNLLKKKEEKTPNTIKAIHYSREPLNLSGEAKPDQDQEFGFGFYAMEPSDEEMWKSMGRWEPGPFKNEVELRPKKPLIVTPQRLKKIVEEAKKDGFSPSKINLWLDEQIRSGKNDAIIIRGFPDEAKKAATSKKIDSLLREKWSPVFPEGKTSGGFINVDEYRAASDAATEEVTGVSRDIYLAFDRLQNQIFVPPSATPNTVRVTKKIGAEKETITPPTEPTPATEGMVTPGGVATERDLTKPEQMTPEEFNQTFMWSSDTKGNRSNGNLKGGSWFAKTAKDTLSFARRESDDPVYAVKKEKIRPIQAELDDIFGQEFIKSGSFIRGGDDVRADFSVPQLFADKPHAYLTRESVKKNQPVSAAAVDTYGITLPKGYVKQGDLYVFQPQTTAAETQISGSVMMSPLVRGMLESFAQASAAWSKAKSAIREQLSGTKEAVYLALAEDDFTMSRNGNVVEISLPKGGSDAFSLGGLGTALDKYFRFGDAKGIAKVAKKAGKPFQITFGNEKDASDFMQYDGRTPSQLNEDFKRLYQQLSKSQPQAAETQTPVPLRNGTGAAGVVQSEPSGGSIPEVAKVSTETETASSGKLDTVAQIDRLVQSGAKPEEMDKFVKSLTDDQFNELVASEAFDVEPKLAIKPKDTYDAKRIKRRKFVDAVNTSTKEVRKTAQQVFQEEEAAAKKQQAGEEMRSKAIDSIIGKGEKQKRKFGQVTNSDAIAAVAMLVSSKDIPGVLTTWWGTKGDFLRDPANQTADPEIYARIKAGELVEGFFNKGRAYVFLDGIGVSDEDMLRGEQMDVSPQVAAVRRVLLHESLVHRGIHGLPLRHRRLILNWVRQNSTPAELDDLAKLYTEYANWRNSDYQFEALAEEFLAKKVDSLTEIPKDGPMAKLMDILRQIWDFIVGYKREPTLSDLKSVLKLLKSGAEALTNDTLKDGGGVKLSAAPPSIANAYNAASVGQSSAFVPLSDVLAKSGMSEQEFTQEVMRLYDRGEVFLEGANSIQEAEQATFSIKGTPVGTAVRIMVPQSFASYASDYTAAKSAGSEAARSTIYSERDMDIREAIRRAYEDMPKQNSVAVPIGDLFAKTEELMPGVTQDEFSNVLQDLFEDNGAVLQEGDVVEPSLGGLSEATGVTGTFYRGENDGNGKIADNEPGGVHFSSARYYAAQYGQVREADLNLTKSLDFRSLGDSFSKESLIAFLQKAGVDLKAKLQPWFSTKSILEHLSQLNTIEQGEIHQTVLDGAGHLIKKAGYDGYVFNELGSATEPSVVVFSESSIKPSTNSPISFKSSRAAGGTSEINVTTPEGKRAGFVVVMPRAAKASRIKAEDAADAAKTFQADIIEAGKGRIDTASYQGNTLKSTEAPDHNVNAPELYKDAAISLVDSLLKKHSITDIADSLQDPEFRVAVGLLGNKAINPNVAQQAELFTGAEIQNRLENSLNKERNPTQKRLIEKALKNHKAYYTTATGIGQNLNAVGALQQDPRFKWMFLFNEAEKEMAEKAKDKLDTITGGGTQPITDMVNQSEEAAADEATKQIEESVEEDEDAALFAEGEASLQGEAKSIWERMKDILRKIAFLDRLDKKDASSAKASLSKADKNTLSSLPKEERAKKRAEFVAEFIALGKMFMGEGKASDTPAQKATRQKRKKMVDTAKKRAEAGKEIEVTRIQIQSFMDELMPGFTERESIVNEVGDALLKAAEQRKAKPRQRTAIQDFVSAIKQTLMANIRGDKISAEQPSLGMLLAKTFAQQGSEAEAFAAAWANGRKKVRAMLSEMGVEEENLDAELDAIMPPTPTLAYAPAAARKAVSNAMREAGLMRSDLLNDPAASKKAIMEKFDEAAKSAKLTEEGWDKKGRALAEKAVDESIAEAKIAQERAKKVAKILSEQAEKPVSLEDFGAKLAEFRFKKDKIAELFNRAKKLAERKIQMANDQAIRVLLAAENKLAQSAFFNASEKPDTIVKAFREQVEEPMERDAFKKRMEKMLVTPEMADKLFDRAARERDNARWKKAQDLLEGPNALQNLLRQMNMARPGQEAPFSKQIPWRKILSQKAKTVEEYRQRIFDAISANEAFQNLSDEQKDRLSDLFSEAWESKRTDILDRMLEREIERKRREGSLSEAAAKALQKSRNKIIELANLGGFDNDDLMKVLGEKFGIKTGFSEAEKARISELADKLQDETLNPAKRNKLAMEFAVTLAGASEIPVAEIISNWWTSSVLFGPQTIFSIGAAFVNGAYGITTIGTRRMLADLTRGDVKGAIEESILMLQGIAKYLGAFKQAGRRAWSYLWTGNVDVLGAAANDILGEINSLEELKRFKRHKLLAENLAKDPRALRRYVGMYLRFVNRLLTSLDAFNVMVTKAGTASLALRMSGMSTDNIIKAEKMLNLKSYKDQVIRDYFDNKAPTTQAEKALVDSYAEAEMYRAIDKLGGKMENADYLASESAMTMNPTGLGGFFYRSITGLDSKMKKAAEDYLEKAKKDWTTEKDLESTLFLGLAYLRQFAVQNLGGVAGYKFIRFASNKFNQGISYLPMVGLLRTLEAKGDEIKGKEAFIETIHRNQVIGAVLTLAAIAVVKALEDEPDDEERGNFWNGGWENLTPDQKKQMLAKGQKEYTMGFKFNGRWYVFNYQNWPLNQVLAAIGSMSDQIRFSPKQWEEKGPLSKSLAGIVSGLKSTLEIPALSQLGTLVGNRLASKDPTEQTVDRLSNVAAGWVGGFVPRILKDLDFATQPELRKYKTLWEKTASHIPIYRRYVGEDYYDILGQPIKRNVIPGSREFMMGPTEPEYKILGALNSRNIFLTPANAEYRMVGKGRNRRRLTQEEADTYSLETGKGYRQMLLRYGQRALQMPTERARAFLSDKADEVRDRALKKVYRR